MSCSICEHSQEQALSSVSSCLKGLLESFDTWGLPTHAEHKAEEQRRKLAEKLIEEEENAKKKAARQAEARAKKKAKKAKQRGAKAAPKAAKEPSSDSEQASFRWPVIPDIQAVAITHMHACIIVGHIRMA
jgi:hypothetical protein